MNGRDRRKIVPAVMGGKVVDPFVTSITPTVGSNVIVNGTFADWTAGDPDGWVTTRTAPNRDITQVAANEGHGGVGTGALNVWQAEAGTAAKSKQAAILTVGGMYRYSAKKTTANSGYVVMGSEFYNWYYNIADASVRNLQFDEMAENADFSVYAYANPSDITVDDISMLPITNTMGGKFILSKDYLIESPMNFVAGTGQGFILNADVWPNPQNYVLVCMGSIQVGAVATSSYIMFGRYLNGVGSVISRSNAATVANGNKLRVTKVGNRFTISYGPYSMAFAGVMPLVYEITDAGVINNTIHAQFSTSASNLFSSITRTSMTSRVHTIWGFGDSKTVGYNSADVATAKDGFFGYLTKGYQSPLRRGVDGQTWASAAPLIAGYLSTTNMGGSTAHTLPEYICVNLGINEVSFAMPADEATFLTNSQAIIDAIHTKFGTSKIFIAHVWRQGNFAANIATINGYIDSLITSRNTFCYNGADERIVLENGDDGASRTYDGVHPNETGYAAMAAAWEAAITAVDAGY